MVFLASSICVSRSLNQDFFSCADEAMTIKDFEADTISGVGLGLGLGLE